MPSVGEDVERERLAGTWTGSAVEAGLVTPQRTGHGSATRCGSSLPVPDPAPLSTGGQTGPCTVSTALPTAAKGEAVGCPPAEDGWAPRCDGAPLGREKGGTVAQGTARMHLGNPRLRARARGWTGARLGPEG